MHGARWQGRNCGGLHHLRDPARGLPDLHAGRRRMRNGEEAARLAGALMSSRQPPAGRASDAVRSKAQLSPHVVPALSRDPYAAAFRRTHKGSRLCQQQKPVVMGPCFRRDDREGEVMARGGDEEDYAVTASAKSSSSSSSSGAMAESGLVDSVIGLRPLWEADAARAAGASRDNA
jgi:hypothetical protein